MSYWNDEYAQKDFDVPLAVIDKKIAKLCDEWGIVTEPEYMTGMRELFDRDGTLIDGYAQEKLESGKKWAFGDRVKEGTWASHLGD